MVALTEQRFTAMSKLAEELELLVQIAALVYFQGRGDVLRWLIAIELRRKGAVIRKCVRKIVNEACGIEIDPTDHLTNRLLSIQIKVKGFALAERERAAMLPWWRRWLARKTERALVAEHRAIGLARTRILEYDADCSPVLDGRFDSATALIAALEKDAA